MELARRAAAKRLDGLQAQALPVVCAPVALSRYACTLGVVTHP